MEWAASVQKCRLVSEYSLIYESQIRVKLDTTYLTEKGDIQCVSYS